MPRGDGPAVSAGFLVPTETIVAAICSASMGPGGKVVNGLTLDAMKRDRPAHSAKHMDRAVGAEGISFPLRPAETLQAR
jgi:hypothetical protein